MTLPRPAGDIGGDRGAADDRSVAIDHAARSCVPPRSMPMASRCCKLQPPPGMARTHAMRWRKILGAEGQRSHHDRLGARLAQPREPCARGCRRRRQARCAAPAPSGAMQRARLAQPRSGLGVEVLPFDADARAEQRQHADAVEEGCGGSNRRMQLQHDAGLRAPSPR